MNPQTQLIQTMNAALESVGLRAVEITKADLLEAAMIEARELIRLGQLNKAENRLREALKEQEP